MPEGRPSSFWLTQPAPARVRAKGVLMLAGGLTLIGMGTCPCEARAQAAPREARAQAGAGEARARSAPPFLSRLHATASDPIYTTYAAAYERSRFLLDEGYHLRFHEPGRGLEYTNQRAGGWGPAFRLAGTGRTGRTGRTGPTLRRVAEMASPPVILVSYGDVVRYRYRPFPDVQVEATFVVHSSRLAVEELALTNTGRASQELVLEQRLRAPPGGFAAVRRSDDGTITFTHREPPDSWTVEHQVPHVSDVTDVVACSLPPDAIRPLADSADVDAEAPPGDAAAGKLAGLVVEKRLVLRPGATLRWRLARGVAPADSGSAALLPELRRLLRAPLDAYVRANERLYRRIPPPPSDDPRRQLLYWTSFTLLHQAMLPPEGRAREPYYVFSREPQWGWGHGGQVFHESLSMLAYALMDPARAMASQRLYAQRQHADGYIPYRVGPYLEETIPYQGALTTSAPWYAWENLELYRLTRDLPFLRAMYGSGKRFWDWLAAHRDTDGDGLFEWGGHAVLESVRDGDVAVWDQVGWPSVFEALDLNAMMVQEAQALAESAAILGLRDDAATWRERARTLADRIERTFWDDSTGFYYHVDRLGGGFTHARPRDLVRREIIGFLPLWAGTASPARAERVLRTLTDSARFWRPAGVPSLAADDPYYNPRGYWNGPVWVEWDYLVERGLLRYGRRDLARGLVDRVAAGMIRQLERTHTFWEMYGPDGDWAGHHQTYIWAGLIARMMLDAHATTPGPLPVDDQLGRESGSSAHAKAPGKAGVPRPGAAESASRPLHSGRTLGLESIRNDPAEDPASAIPAGAWLRPCFATSREMNMRPPPSPEPPGGDRP